MDSCQCGIEGDYFKMKSFTAIVNLQNSVCCGCQAVAPVYDTGRMRNPMEATRMVMSGLAMLKMQQGR